VFGVALTLLSDSHADRPSGRQVNSSLDANAPLPTATDASLSAIMAVGATPEEFVQRALDAHPTGLGTAPPARQERPNDYGRESASQAEHSHCRWHEDGGKGKPTKVPHKHW